MTDSAHSYDLSTFRRLLLAAFTAEDLPRFCEDRPAFRPIVARLTSPCGLDDIVDEVLHYCDTHRLFAELEAAVEQENPAQYARFEPFLRAGSEAVSIKTLKRGSTLLKGKYGIERYLARGGYGSVYLAIDTLLAEPVAVKELVPALVGDEGAPKRFLVEAKTTLKLAHPHLVHTRDLFSEGGNYYMVMEYMPGGSLEDRLTQGKTLSVEDSVRVVVEVCEGLAYAHARGVVHCDLKPGNVMFDADGSAKVADFGVAHVSEQMLTRSWVTTGPFMAGTLPYMSPEQADGVRDDPRVDIYAAGAILYRALTGRPYLEFDERDTPVAQGDNVRRICSEVPLPPSTHNRRIPAWLDAIALKALAKQPEDRYVTADQMRAALLRGEARPVASSPMHPGGPPEAGRPDAGLDLPLPEPAAQPVLAGQGLMAGGRSRERNPWLAGAAGVLVVALIVGLVLALGLGGRDEQGSTPQATVVAVARETPSPAPTLAASPTPISASDTPPPTSTRSKDGMVMVYVPAGPFLMGSTGAELGANDDEKPQHTVTLDAFWIDRTEVTNAQYSKCVEANVCQTANMPSYDPQGNPNRPVVEVNWSDARTYCQWAGARLPTEAEWEKAARGANGQIFPWGNDKPDCSRANFWPNDGACVETTSAVGSYPTGASPYGALDLGGNVWEWVADWYGESYYTGSPARNPMGPDSGRHRVMRGGALNTGWEGTRAAHRDHRPPDNRSGDLGFRCGAAAPGG